MKRRKRSKPKAAKPEGENAFLGSRDDLMGGQQKELVTPSLEKKAGETRRTYRGRIKGDPLMLTMERVYRRRRTR